MPAFIESMTGLKRNELAKGPPKKGAPQILVVCAAAIRAAELTRTMRCYQSKGGGTIAKLFAKHIKFKDAVDFVKKNKYVEMNSSYNGCDHHRRRRLGCYKASVTIR